MAKRLYILGLGVDPIRHSSIEVLETLGHCDKIFIQGLAPDHRRYLARFLAKIKPEIVPEGDAPKTVKKILGHVKAGRTTAWVTLGHPFYWNGIGASLTRGCAQIGADWKTFGAVSPMGMGLSAAGSTLGTEIFGMQSFDATAVAGRRAVLNKAWPFFLYFLQPVTSSGFQECVDRLTETYGQDHPVVLFRSGKDPQPLKLEGMRSRYKAMSRQTIAYFEPKLECTSILGRTDSGEDATKPGVTPAWVRE